MLGVHSDTLPISEGFNQYGTEDTAVFITASGDSESGGIAYFLATGKHNLGVYQVDATYHRCGNPPPGYSTEQGRNGFLQIIGNGVGRNVDECGLCQ